MPGLNSSDPLAAFPLFESGSVDEAETILSKSLTSCCIRSGAAKGGFHLQMNGVEFGRASLIFNRYGADTEVESELPGDPVFFNIGSGAVSKFRLGSRRIQTDPDCSTLLAESNRMVVERPENSGMVVLRVWAADLESQLETLLDRNHRGRLVFDREADFNRGAGASLQRLIGFLLSELEQHPEMANNPIFRRSWEEMFLNSLLSLPHNRQRLLAEERPYEVSPGVVVRAEEYMREHLAEPITIADLLHLCECSRSALFYAFRNARGYTPMEFLVEQRLQLARRRLQQGGEASTVSCIATDCGFVHLGRFASVYRRRFGEAPSETLRRSNPG